MTDEKLSRFQEIFRMVSQLEDVGYEGYFSVNSGPITDLFGGVRASLVPDNGEEVVSALKLASDWHVAGGEREDQVVLCAGAWTVILSARFGPKAK